MRNFLRTHPVGATIASIAVALTGFLAWLATVWPAFVRDKTIPEWVASLDLSGLRRWSLLAGGVLLAVAIGVYIWRVSANATLAIVVRKLQRAWLPLAAVIVALVVGFGLGASWRSSRATPMASLRVVYLWDVSASFAPKWTDAASTLSNLVQSVLQDRQWQAQRHTILPIGADVTAIDAVCEIDDRLSPTSALFAQTFERNLLEKSRRLRECLEALRQKVGARQTDIEASVRLAALSMRRLEPGVRVMVLLTDGIQDRRFADRGPDMALDGICVALLGDTAASRDDVANLERRMTSWQDYFRKARVQKFEWWHRAAFDPGEFRRFLSGCADQSPPRS